MYVLQPIIATSCVSSGIAMYHEGEVAINSPEKGAIAKRKAIGITKSRLSLHKLLMDFINCVFATSNLLEIAILILYGPS